MDDSVARSLLKWPDVPDVYGWLSLDRRGNFLIRSTSAPPSFERIGNAALREFICRNYQADARGCWYFQNGPQRVFVKLAYTPLVAHLQGESLFDHCGREFGEPSQVLLDDEGSILLAGGTGLAVLDDRDLERFSDRLEEGAEALPRVSRGSVPRQFGFEPDPV